jgi:Protein of unknown function (DUF402)
MWSKGDVVEYRQVVRGKPWCVTPARVVEDNEDLLVLWWPQGTQYLLGTHDDRHDVLHRWASGTWDLAKTEWWGGPSLQVVPTGAAFALWPFRLEPDNDVLGWYCNLQRPLERTARGFDSEDWTLDVWAEADLSGWHWKDEDELQVGIDAEVYNAEDVARIRAAGDDVVALIEARDPIFAEWRDWKAPADWFDLPPRLDR